MDMLRTSPPPLPPVLGIAGSLRRRSWNRLLLDAAVTVAAPHLELTPYCALERVPLFNEDIERPLPDGVRELRNAVRRADGLLIATPEYNQSLPGVLKNALDWLSRDETLLKAKPVAVMGVTVGRWGTRLSQAAVRQTLNAMGALVMPEPMLFVSHAERSFDAQGQLHDRDLAAGLQSVVRSLRSWIELQRRPLAAQSAAMSTPLQ